MRKDCQSNTPGSQKQGGEHGCEEQREGGKYGIFAPFSSPPYSKGCKKACDEGEKDRRGLQEVEGQEQEQKGKLKNEKSADDPEKILGAGTVFLKRYAPEKQRRGYAHACGEQ